MKILKKLTSHPILVIGAGAAGIAAADLLEQHGAYYQIVEAQNRAGGRVESFLLDEKFAIELGAEEIHGQFSELKQWVERKNIPFFIPKGQIFYHINHQLLPDYEAETLPEFERLHQFMNSIKEQPQYWGFTLKEALQYADFQPNYQKIAAAWLANEYGTDAENLQLGATYETLSLWKAGGHNYQLECAYWSIFEKNFPKILKNIQFQKVVTHIDATPKKYINVSFADGTALKASKVLITIPLSQLKKGAIVFNPALPMEKQMAIEHLQMGSALKATFLFEQPIWHPRTASIYTDGLIPECWVSSKQKTDKYHTLTALINGKNDALFAESEEVIIGKLIEALKSIFGEEAVNNHLKKLYLKNWNQTAYIEGGYSYPVIDDTKHRFHLAQNIAQRIFFAGEATHFEGHFATVHGAVETGRRAAVEMVKRKG